MRTTSMTAPGSATVSPLGDPDALVRVFRRVGVVSILAVIALTCYGIYRVSLARVIASAEDSAVALAEALMDHETGGLLVPQADGSVELQLDPRAAPVIDAGFKKYLHHFAFLKIKVFDRRARIVYSTDPMIVGKEDPDNRSLARALAGENVSQVATRGHVADFHGAERFDVDVVETYVPVRDGRGRIVGSVELYRDVTPYRRGLLPVVATAGGIMALILGTGFLLAVILLQKEARALRGVQDILRDQANTDYLTGTYNRRLLLERSAQELARQRRLAEQGEPAGLGCAMIDVDHFKRINDTLGHGVGDEVIRHVAACLVGAIRPYDFVGRYGGDEFVVVFPDLAAAQLPPVVERLVAAVRAAPFTHRGRALPVTISVGVAAARPDEARPEDILARADTALYRAKLEGRDTIRYAE